MALLKSIDLPNGFSAEYHKIQELSIQHNDAVKLSVMVCSYKDQAAREAGKSPVVSANRSLNGSIDLSQPLVAQAYALLKACSDMSGAQDS